MARSLDQLVEECRQFPQELRAELVERILLGALGDLAPQSEQYCLRETRRRVVELQSKEAQHRFFPIEQSLAEIKKIAGL